MKQRRCYKKICVKNFLVLPTPFFLSRQDLYYKTTQKIIVYCLVGRECKLSCWRGKVTYYSEDKAEIRMQIINLMIFIINLLDYGPCERYVSIRYEYRACFHALPCYEPRDLGAIMTIFPILFQFTNNDVFVRCRYCQEARRRSKAS